MREHEVAIASEHGLAGALCLPAPAGPSAPAPAMVLLGGSGADTRDGDLEPGWPPGTPGLPAPGTLRRVAHHLAKRGIASLRWDRRGFGASGGRAADAGYATDLADARAALGWLRERPEVDPDRVAVAGHSAGALTACRLCHHGGVAAAALLGALASPIEDVLRWNLGRIDRHWDELGPDRRDWLTANLPAHVVRGRGLEAILAAARRGDASVTLEGLGVTVEVPTARLRHDLATSYVAEMAQVRVPALVLHGGDDLNVPAGDALVAYRALRDGGNDDVSLVVLARLDHYFTPTAADPGQRIWERVSLRGLLRPMAPEALAALSGWAAGVLGPSRRP